MKNEGDSKQQNIKKHLKFNRNPQQGELHVKNRPTSIWNKQKTSTYGKDKVQLLKPHKLRYSQSCCCAQMKEDNCVYERFSTAVFGIR